MPTLTSQDPDHFDLDYFHNKYNDRYGTMIREVQPTQLKVMPFAFNPSECNTAKSLHYFKTPTQPTIVRCYCQKFHTLFTSSNLNIPPRQATPPPSSQKSTYMDIDITPKQVKQLKEIIPQSPIAKTTTIPPLPFPLNYSTTQQGTSSSSKQTPQIQAHSHHAHTCIICQNKNILCAFLENNTHSLLDKSILIIKGFPAHPKCIHKLKLKPIIQTKALTPIQIQTALVIKFTLLSKEEKISIFKKFLGLLKQNKINKINKKQQNPYQKQPITKNPLISKLTPLTPTTDETSNNEQQQSYSQAARPKLNPSFDWLANFPVTDEMQNHTKLETEISRQLFNFLKEHLYNFYPGKVLKEATETKYALKASFYLLIRQMAGTRPKFLIDLIQKHNSETDKAATIPFNILEESLKKLIHTFTTVFFTKLNYPEIFASPATIPPIKTENRLQFCLNLARLHLYLSNNYQAINYTKFAEDIKLRPKRFKITSEVTDFDKEQQYLSIKMDNRFNIKLNFNFLKSFFLDKYNIPSLKNSLSHFNEWFKKAFLLYS
jgi:hypothetical protein